MALTDADKVKALGFEPEHFDLSTADELTILIDGRIAEAAKRLKDWMGDDAYADAEEASPSDPTRAAAMLDAETFLTAVELIKIQRQRMVALIGSFKVSDTSRNVSRDNLQAFDEQENYWLAQATRVLSPWLSGEVGFVSKEEEL